MKRISRKIRIGDIYIGGDYPVSIQGMTKTPTSHTAHLLKEVRSMVKEGAEIVRIAILNEADVQSIQVLKSTFSIPMVADIHYSKKLAIMSIDAGIDKLRINPGNLGKQDTREVIKAAREHSIPIRIGLNSGSINIRKSLKESMLSSAMDSIKLFTDMDFHEIILSVKTPSVRETIECYSELASLCDYPLHLGITEAGKGALAEAKSILGIGMLLYQGIGDTLRVSLTEPSVKEIKVGKSILQALGLRKFHPELISCPTCGRCRTDMRPVVKDVEKELLKIEKEKPEIKKLKIAVMGCGVNGPGEAKQADIGIASVNKNSFALFKKGHQKGTYVKETAVKKMIEEILSMV